MTTDEIRDELARRAGWNKPGTPIPLTKDWRLGTAETQSFVYGHWWKAFGETTMRQYDHPFPPTLDGANAAVPEGWFPWERRKGPQGLFWEAIHPQWRGGLNPHLCVRVPDTGDPVHDLFALALACVRAEAVKR